jgi:hypothetical protein
MTLGLGTCGDGKLEVEMNRTLGDASESASVGVGGRVLPKKAIDGQSTASDWYPVQHAQRPPNDPMIRRLDDRGNFCRSIP